MSDEIKNENPGVVTSDSLAAESINAGGDFGSNTDSRGPNSQPSASTTTNVTDVSNATELPPAPDRPSRNDDPSSTELLDSGLDEQAAVGRGPTWNASGRPAASNEPTADYREITHTDKPKGTGIAEGGFDSDGPNASFGSEIGSKRDPGRVALQGIQASNTPYAGGAGPRQTDVSDDGQFDALGGDASA